LIDPPGSDLHEATFVRGIAEAADAELLLDLHNLHANSANFAFDALAFLDALPVHRIRAVHLAGGRWISASSGQRRLLDDHLHDVPEAVFTLLARSFEKKRAAQVPCRSAWSRRLVALGRYVSLALPSLRARSRRAWRRSRA
jgi:uncharacterized protein (UPF0276 family)